MPSGVAVPSGRGAGCREPMLGDLVVQSPGGVDHQARDSSVPSPSPARGRERGGGRDTRSRRTEGDLARISPSPGFTSRNPPTEGTEWPWWWSRDGRPPGHLGHPGLNQSPGGAGSPGAEGRPHRLGRMTEDRRHSTPRRPAIMSHSQVRNAIATEHRCTLGDHRELMSRGASLGTSSRLVGARKSTE